MIMSRYFSKILIPYSFEDKVGAVGPRQPTRADNLHAALRADILSGLLVPGQRLRFQELGVRYGSSVGAAREALTRLVAENLVSVQPRQGYRVTTLSRDDLADLVQARVEVESLACRLSVAAGDMAWEGRLVAAHHVLVRTSFAADNGTVPSGDWAAAHRDFHLALISACPNRRLLTFAGSLREEAALYQVWAVAAHSPERRDELREQRMPEHRALLDAATDRDVAIVEQLMREHLAQTGRIVLDLTHAEPLAGPDKQEDKAS
jgi:DNA-binding GntR family transcriptional regulator